MKKFQQLMCLGLVGGLGFGAQASAVEQFNYPAGDLDGLNGGSGWAAGWGTSTTWSVDATGLEHPNLTGETGGKAFGTTNSRANRTLSQAYDSGTVYVSFLMQMAAPNTNLETPFSAFELGSGEDGDNGRVFELGALRNNDANGNDGYAFRLQSEPGGSTAFTSPLSPGFSTDVNLFVLAFDLDSDTLEVFVNPDNTTDLSGVGEVSANLFTDFSFDRVGLANFVAADNDTSIDEIRIDTTAPTLVPEPSSLALLGLGGLLIARRRRG